jgi:ABC-type transport system involved in multi-copper enzyme maturation permease subunit
MFVYLSLLLVLETASAEMDAQQIQDFEEFISLPETTSFGFGFTHQLAAIMAVILVSSSITTEFGWRTVITLVAWTGNRLHIVGAKLVTAALASAVLVGIGFVASFSGSFMSSLIHGSLELSDLGVDFIGDLVAGFGRTWLAVLVFPAGAALIAMWTRSTAAAIAITLAFMFLEPFGLIVVDLLPDPLPALGDLLVSTNTSALLSANGSLQELNDGGSDLPSAWQAAAYLLVVTVASAWLTVRLFVRRDINV